MMHIPPGLLKKSAPNPKMNAMGHITFNAFSFLQKKLKARNIPCTQAQIPIKDGECVQDLLNSLGIDPDEIEGVFVNGRISSLNTPLHDGDRIGALPPGTPGPYRLLLGIVDPSNPKKGDSHS